MRINKISSPTLVIGSEFDSIKPVKFSKIIHENIKNSECVIIGESGHAVNIEKFNEVQTLILGFLEKIKLFERSD